MQSNKDIQQEMQDPAEGTAKANALRECNLALQPLEGIHVEFNGLETTEQAGGAEGNPPGHSVKIEDKLTSSIIKERFQPKHCHCLRNSFMKKNQAVS